MSDAVEEDSPESVVHAYGSGVLLPQWLDNVEKGRKIKLIGKFKGALRWLMKANVTTS